MLGTAICVSACLVVVALVLLAGSLFFKSSKVKKEQRTGLRLRRGGWFTFALVLVGWFVYLVAIRETWAKTNPLGALAVCAFAGVVLGLYRFMQTLPLREWRARLSDSPWWNRIVN